MKKEKQVMDYFLEDLKEGRVSKEDKQRLYEIVYNLESNTENQKRRFIEYYNLKDENENYTLKSYSQKEERTISAIKYSLFSIRIGFNKIEDVKTKGRLLAIINNTRNGRY